MIATSYPKFIILSINWFQILDTILGNAEKIDQVTIIIRIIVTDTSISIEIERLLQETSQFPKIVHCN